MKTKHKNNLKHKIFFLFFFIIILYCLYGYSLDRYYKFYPTINLYPNNFHEVQIVQQYVQDRNSQMSDFIKYTDKSVIYPFLDIVDESPEQLNKIIVQNNTIILFFKNLFNRARPKQIDPHLDVFNSISANTPAFPSGHTYQAYSLAYKLSDKYPEKKEQLFHIAEKCGQARIYAGLHYPSDHLFSKLLVDFF